MRRSFFLRGLALLASTTGLIVGCTETPTEGDLPPAKIAAPEDMANLQKKLEQEKVAKGATYKAPPGINLPKK